MRVSEGGVTVEVPEQSGDGTGAAVFFNPDQELNRDLTVATIKAYRDRIGKREEHPVETYLDATAASGIRGVRAAANGFEATLCDVDSEAVERCQANLGANDLDAEVEQRNANALMHERQFDVVDLDPFGTPIPFVDAAVQSASRLLAVTATDLAPLCGAHFQSGVRSYGAIPRNTEYHSEMGVRILLGALIRTAARYDVAAEPILTHASDHYVRTYLEFAYGAQVADMALEELGYVYHCQHCLYRETELGLIAHPPADCLACGHHLQAAGPLWLGSTHDTPFLERVGDHVGADMGTADRASSLLETMVAELDEPTHYDQHRLCKRWDRSAAAMDEFLTALRGAGYEASRTHYGGTTFKTTANVEEIRSATA